MITVDGVLDRKLDRVYTMLDSDGDGGLVETDVTALADNLGAAFGLPADSPKVRALRASLAELWNADVRFMDSDGNGVVDRQEFIAGMRRSAADDREAYLDRLDVMVEAWMGICDADDNGLIDQHEFVTMYTRTLGASPTDLVLAFSELDLDGNGTLDREEIRKATEEYYTSDDPQAPGNWLFGPF
ncbi:EF-hand domain-containing protein [Streptacidiphilus jiangxiensis]|uniref:Ca2+-binding protein, EF-hand superfamily n=1 Tax=Streptacidiphilus jiangxiensis TaxID=235985 RepID=A0A1H7T2B1_STRJI|nr:EF-hand domain-containing protein [Streptacidiphilus jiangxiensis]SEL78665.1 Ca2+-binding protein, EF-hand superfamily [Streptacidiphilus jiangxiensis]